jgi:hypothetical protein
MEFVNWLAVRANNQEQLDFLKSVTHFINEYESSKRTKLLPLNQLELLNALVKENDVTTRELGTILDIDHSTASRLLTGERPINPSIRHTFCTRRKRYSSSDVARTTQGQPSWK